MNDILLIGEVIEVVGIATKIIVYKEKNTSRLLYNGNIIKNVAVGNYIKILKGYTEIIAVIEGEYIKEVKNVDVFSKHTDTYTRILDIKILGYFDGNRSFVKGIYETPMISNYAYVLKEDEVQKIFCFTRKDEPVIEIGNISGYDYYKLNVSIQRLFVSHIGIFGNTGSGKSNTLAKLYTEMFKANLNFKKSKFLLIDFNDEYISNDVLISDKKVYKLDTRVQGGDKYPLPRTVIEDSTFWSIIFEATEKTQRPFLDRVIKSYKYYINESISFNDLNKILFENPSKFISTKTDIIEFLKKLYGGYSTNYENIFEELEYFNKTNCLWIPSINKFFYNSDELEAYLKERMK